MAKWKEVNLNGGLGVLRFGKSNFSSCGNSGVCLEGFFLEMVFGMVVDSGFMQYA